MMRRQNQLQGDKIQRREHPAGSFSIIPIESASATPRTRSFCSPLPPHG